jgi:GrpB-like predicted nucleotidyltransferase (UPF0157 family)
VPEVEVVAYDPGWVRDFGVLAARLREELGARALRIDHIGSTSIPGMPAKSVIDVQVPVASLDPSADLIKAFRRAGFEPRMEPWNTRDHLPAGWHGSESEWDKLVFSPSSYPREQRPRQGRRARQPALRAPFRDYLRAHPGAARAFGEFKRRLAPRFAEDLRSYGQIKDPVCDLIMVAAEAWASTISWKPE